MKQFLCAAVLTATLSLSASAQSVTLTDTEMELAGWGAVNTGVGGFGRVHLGNGNPGGCMEVTHVVPGGFQLVNVEHTLAGSYYDPARMGPLSSVTFAIDHRSNGITAFGFVAVQDGVTYYADYQLTLTDLVWHTHVSATFAAADFEINGLNPDFGAAASPIVFGFYTANSSTIGGYTRVASFDNFTLTLATGGLTGSGEDLALGTTVNAPSSLVSDDVVFARVGDAVSFRYGSPLGGFDFAPALLLGQVIATGDHVFSPSFFPEFRLDLSQLVLLQEAGLAPGGNVATGVVPVGIAGTSVFAQALAISGAANNGFFATSEANEVRILP